MLNFLMQVVYGEKKVADGSKVKGHVAELASSVEELARLEKNSQSNFIKMATDKRWFL